MPEYEIGSIQWGENLKKELLRLDNQIMDIFTNAIFDLEYEMIYDENVDDWEDEEEFNERKQRLINNLEGCEYNALMDLYGYMSPECQKYTRLNQEFNQIDELLGQYPESTWFHSEPKLTQLELESAGQQILPSISKD